MKNHSNTIKFIIIYALLILGLILAYRSKGQEVWKPNTAVTRKAQGDSTRQVKALFQCWGTTKKGERCRRKVECNKCYCYQHADQK